LPAALAQIFCPRRGCRGFQSVYLFLLHMARGGLSLYPVQITSAYLSIAAYVIQCSLYALCIMNMLKRRPRRRAAYCIAIFITTLCGMNTVETVDCAILSWWTDIHPVYARYVTSSKVIVGYITMVMIETSLLWRCYTIWTLTSASKWNYLMVIPGIMLVASAALGVPCILDTITLTQQSFLNAAPTDTSATTPRGTRPFLAIHFGLSLSLHILLTLMIILRLRLHVSRLRALVGPASNAYQPYHLISTMFLHSSILVSLLLCATIATISLRAETLQIWINTGSSIQIISLYIFIYGVAIWKARKVDNTSRSSDDLESLEFRRSQSFLESVAFE